MATAVDVAFAARVIATVGVQLGDRTQVHVDSKARVGRKHTPTGTEGIGHE